jgi:hypothetical protein
MLELFITDDLAKVNAKKALQDIGPAAKTEFFQSSAALLRIISFTLRFQLCFGCVTDKPLWDGYNEFYGRVGVLALAGEITPSTWERFHNPEETLCNIR